MKRIVLASATILTLFASCSKKPFSAGPVVTEQRVLTDSISAITVNGSMDVIITQDTSYEIEIHANEDVMEYIETDVVNHELIIDEELNHYTNKTVTIYVSAQYLNDISLKGSGDITGANLVTDHAFISLKGSGDIDLNFYSINDIDIDLKGSGDIKIQGIVDQNNTDLEGSGDVDCKDLIAIEANIDLEGSGDVNVYASDELTIDVKGSGDVNFWGNPTTVNKNITGSGDINEM